MLFDLWCISWLIFFTSVGLQHLSNNDLKISYSTPLPADLSQVWPEANQHFSKEIDDEANSYFQRIYNHPPHPTMSVDEVCSDLILLSLPKTYTNVYQAHAFRQLFISCTLTCWWSCCSANWLIFIYNTACLLGTGDVAEVQGFNHQTWARGFQLHASEPVWGVPILPPVPRQGAAYHCLPFWWHYREGSCHLHGLGPGSPICSWSLKKTFWIQNVLLWNCCPR